MITNIINWIIENRDWVFSGIGVTILLGIINLIHKFFSKANKPKDTIKINQKNEGQDNTVIGIQNNYYGGNKND